ncbi:uncharacterized protein PAC_15417 [Phialocephala subalpina]|uniref:Methyltransferase type 11 domain-containing protein n=1 Tax=Phialocephala subalpina TaxID=576137 RepID=A0A1L7XKP9_9HELO|nr:uncharacterized protein PAC_15417 [Phialocephala subalpina]
MRSANLKLSEYNLPIDEMEKERLSISTLFSILVHNTERSIVAENMILRSIFRLYYAQSNHHVAFWTKTVSRGEVISVDICPIQAPEYKPFEPTIQGIDAEDEWKMQDFDFIHFSMTFTCFKAGREMFDKAYKALRPGGCIEFKDWLFPLQSLFMPANALEEWSKAILQAVRDLGKDWECPKGSCSRLDQGQYTTNEVRRMYY